MKRSKRWPDMTNPINLGLTFYVGLFLIFVTLGAIAAFIEGNLANL